MRRKKIDLDLSLLFFILSLLAFSGLAGLAIGVFGSDEIRYLIGQVKTLGTDPWKNPLVEPVRHDTAFGYHRYSDFVDPGFLLLTGYLMDEQRVGIRLVRLSDGAVVKRWYPDPEAIRELSDFPEFQDVSRFEPQHPILMADGGLVFIDNQGPLVRIDSCDRIKWIVDGQFHHSLERDLDGNFILPSVNRDVVLTPLMRKPFRDDIISVVSVNGEVLDRRSIADILIDNGYGALAHTTYPVEKDFSHLNDVEVARHDSASWRRGDWVLSLRALNTVLIYRPSTHKITWLSTGPWFKQHDPDFLDNGTIAVFGNDVVGRRGPYIYGHSNIYIIDPKTNSYERPYEEVLKSEKVGTKTQGLLEILDNGDVFIEETDHGRIFRIGEKGAVWSYHNATAEGAGVLNWSRYLTEADVREVDLSRPCP